MYVTLKVCDDLKTMKSWSFSNLSNIKIYKNNN